MRKLSRREFLFGSVATTFAVGSYAHYLEPYWLDVDLVTVSLPSWNRRSPIKILHLSDFHLSKSVPLEFIAQSIDLGLSLRPDIICVTGDFVTRRSINREFGEVLSRLSRSAPTYAIAGNHDGGAWVKPLGGYETLNELRELLSESGINFLENHRSTVTAAGTSVQIVGVGDLWANDLDARKAFEGSDAALPRVVLCHNPDGKTALKNYKWDLMLCGHTHGGQVCIPFIGAPIVPIKDRRFISGLNPWDGRLIYTSKGVGNLIGIRINCRPQISLLTLS